MKKLLLISLLYASVAVGQGSGVAAPLGLELGKATCSDVDRRLPKGNAKKAISAWSNGPTIETANVKALEIEGLQHVTAICSKDDGRLLALQLEFSKGGVGGSQVRETASQLDAKYKSLRSDLPLVGNASAEWQADNCTIELDAPHLSFSFSVTYLTPEASQMYRKWRQSEVRQRQAKKAGSL